MLAFVAVAVVVIVTPGQDTALTVRNALTGGRAAGIRTAAGVALGQAVWALATSLGLAALIVASEPAFVALKLAGAAYLVWLGLRTLLGALHRAGRDGSPDFSHHGGDRSGRPVELRQGLVSNLANPKMAVFFTSLLPQFADTFAGLMALGLLFCAMTLAWLSAYAIAVARAAGLLGRPRVRRSLDAVLGSVLVAVGIRLAAAER